MNNVAGLILAAGASSRMGSPKALLKVRDNTLLEDQVNRLRHAGCDPVIVVVGSEADKIMGHHGDLDIIWALNHEWGKGHFSSILCGLKETSSSTLLLTIDTVGVPIETIKEILGKGLQENKNIIPTFENRGGHPVFLTTEFIHQTLKTASPNDRLDHLLPNDPETLRLETNSNSILNNINTMGEWQEFIGFGGSV